MFTKKIIIKIFSIIYIFTTFLVSPVLALENLKDAEFNAFLFSEFGGYKTETVIDIIIGDIIKYFLSFLGIIFLGLLIYGGFTWMRARGDDSAVSTAKETMINASTGLIIVLGSYAATAWVMENLAKTTLQ